MKKKTLLLLLLCAISVAAFQEGGRQSNGGTAATGIAFLLPQPDTDFSDLDVRDAQNQPIQSPSAIEKLNALFRENLIDLTVFAALHPVSEEMKWIDSLSCLFNRSFLLRLPAVFEAFMEAFLPPSRRFVHNVHNLWITFSVGILTNFLLLSAFSLKRSSLHIYLRL